MAGRADAPGRVGVPLAAAMLVGAMALSAHAVATRAAPGGGHGGADCRGRVDAVRSHAGFDVLFRLPLHLRGRFTRIDGALSPDPEGCRVRVVIDTDSLRVDGPEWMLRTARSPAFLDVEAHPVAVFDSDPFPASRLNAGGVLSGRLHLRGRERPVHFLVLASDCRPIGTPDCPLRVQGDIPRRDFGMTSRRTTVRDPVRFAFAIVLDEAPR